MLFTCIKSWFFRNHLANFHQISHWSFCWNVIDSLFKWSCSIYCQAHIFFFKTKNCSNDDIFISCDDRIGKMLHNICMSAVAMSLRWANRCPWASCYANILIRLVLMALYSTPLNLHRRTVGRYLPTTSTTSWSVSFTPRSLVFLTASQSSIRDTLYIGDVDKPTAERYCHTKLVYNVWLQHLSPPAASSDFRTFVLSTVTW